MRIWIVFFLTGLLLLPENTIAQMSPKPQTTPKAKTKEMYIQTDLPPPPSAEEVVPQHPFFAAPSTGNELLGRIEELEERVTALEKKEHERKRIESQGPATAP